MRFKLILNVEKQARGTLLPLNYQYELASAIYKILANADQQYSDWLHKNGFMFENWKKFKLFTFSRFRIRQWKIEKGSDRLQILSDSVEWELSFLPQQATRDFIQGIFLNRMFEIGDSKSSVLFSVREIVLLDPPEFREEMTFRTMSPLCLKEIDSDKRTTVYLSPKDERAPFILFNGLMDKYRMAARKCFTDCEKAESNLTGAVEKEPAFSLDDCKLTLLEEPKSVLVKIKADTPQQTFVRGYMGVLRVRAPKELMRVMYEGGAGSHCSLGFGCLRVIG